MAVPAWKLAEGERSRKISTVAYGRPLSILGHAAVFAGRVAARREARLLPDLPVVAERPVDRGKGQVVSLEEPQIERLLAGAGLLQTG